MRQSWKLALAGIIALSMAGCANDENRDGGGGGNEMNRDGRTNPITREQENREDALPMQAVPESGAAVSGNTGDQRVQNPKTTVIARGGVPTAKVDVNSATMEELHAVPGISHNMAEAIINNRPYRNQQDLIKRVPNLDKRFLASFDQYLTIGPAREQAAPTGDN